MAWIVELLHSVTQCCVHQEGRQPDWFNVDAAWSQAGMFHGRVLVFSRC